MHANLVRAEFLHDPINDGLKVIDKRAAVGVAQRKIRHPALDRSRKRADGVIRISAVTVEKMLRIINHLTALRGEVAGRVLNHREIFLQCGADDFRDVERPRFSHDGRNRHTAVQERLDLSVFGSFDPGAASGTERRQLGVLEAKFLRLLKIGDVAWIGAGETALDIIHAKLIELLGNEEFVGD